MKLSDLIKTQELLIPDTDLKIKIKEELSWYEYLEGTKISDPSTRGIYTITCMIQAWNLTDDDGKELPINEATVKSLPKEIGQVLIDKFNDIFIAYGKKKRIN
jgi:hypothetical protein